jgi:hypothetical protein
MATGGFCEKVIKINYLENGRSVTVRTDRTRSSGGNPSVESQKEGRNETIKRRKEEAKERKRTRQARKGNIRNGEGNYKAIREQDQNQEKN